MAKIKIVLPIIFFGTIMQTVFAQALRDNNNILSGTTLKKITLGYDAGIEWEQKISRFSTITLFAGVTAGLSTDDWTDFWAKLIIGPSTFAEYKNYYNLQKRAKKGKKTANNSGNFLLFKTEVFFPVKNQNYLGVLISQGWGLQRAISKKINVEWKMGITEHIFYDKLVYNPGGAPYIKPYVKLHPFALLSFSYLF